jgi:2-polyprenyl-6-hydroxyphenyl methylase/3-demethylubiquinone-9 3-methyltransferase
MAVRSHPALRVFGSLPLRERLFVRARLFSAPLVELSRRARGERVLDVGCGHGLLCALLTQDAPGRSVTGIDPDPRKIDWARASVGQRATARFEVATAEALAAREPEAYDTITIADVLYLLPDSAQPSLLEACRRLLKPGGLLLLKEAEDDGGWRAKKALLQERLMVRLLGRTRSSGGLGFRSREATQVALAAAGFRVDETLALSRGSTTPHVLFVANRA